MTARRLRVAIVGRPNVGKSTLFNRLIRKRRAITLDTPGVTRDPISEPVTWDGLELDLVDTGGLGGEQAIALADRVHEHTVRAIHASDLLVVLLDAKEGLSPLDRESVELVARSGVPALYIANKAEGRAGEDTALEFCALGIDPPLTISAEHGQGMTELRMAIVEEAQRILAERGARLADDSVSDEEARDGAEPPDDDGTDAGEDDAGGEVSAEDGRANGDDQTSRSSDRRSATRKKRDGARQEITAEQAAASEAVAAARPIRVAFVGRPNVGKSSLLNHVAGSELSLVDDRPGTTRDVVDIEIERRGRRYVLLDTAGMRRPSRVEEGIERISVRRSIEAIDRADVVALLIEPTEGLTDQDARIANRAWSEGRALVLLLNKIDLVEPARVSEVERQIRGSYPTLAPVPLAPMSVRQGRGIDEAFRLIDRAHRAHNRRIATAEVNRVIGEAVARREPPVLGAGRAKFFYGTQTAVRPPSIDIFTNRAQVPEEYQRFIERCFREEIDLTGTPLRLRLVRRSSHGKRDEDGKR